MKAKFSYDEYGALVIRRGEYAVCIPKSQISEIEEFLKSTEKPVKGWAKNGFWKESKCYEVYSL